MIGVFDSGHGGLTILDALHRRLPRQGFIYLGDHGNAPYGLRAPDEIYDLTRQGVADLFGLGCTLVILACNTAAAVALRRLQQERHMSVLLITHDLGVVAQIADEVCVMYASHIVERASVRELFANPLHPYTEGLLASVPVPDPHVRREARPVLPGDVPSPSNRPRGCHFHTRCPYAFDRCREVEPKLRTVEMPRLSARSPTAAGTGEPPRPTRAIFSACFSVKSG